MKDKIETMLNELFYGTSSSFFEMVNELSTEEIQLAFRKAAGNLQERLEPDSNLHMHLAALVAFADIGIQRALEK